MGTNLYSNKKQAECNWSKINLKNVWHGRYLGEASMFSYIDNNISDDKLEQVHITSRVENN